MNCKNREYIHTDDHTIDINAKVLQLHFEINLKTLKDPLDAACS